MRVFGYARLNVAATPLRVRRWRSRITAYCATEGLGAPDLVFIDVGVSDTCLIRPGWVALVDVLGLPGAEGEGHPVVVVPSLAHLSADPATLSRMRVELDVADVLTVVMPRTQPHRRPRSAGRSVPGERGAHGPPIAT